jgi:hypothetical protein
VPDDPEDLAVLELETHVVEGQETVEVLLESAGGDHAQPFL